MSPVIDWLLDSDPAIRWQAERDLLRRPEPEWQATRARVETEGWGAALLAAQGEDGLWAGAAFWPQGFTRDDWQAEGQAWTATSFTLTLLRDLGLPPDSARMRRTVALLAQNGRWEEGDQPYWQGETEECINGRTLADGGYFGAPVAGIAARLMGEGQADGGWNCDRCRGSQRSSFDSTINVLEGLLEYHRLTGDPAARAAILRGQEYLLQRHLFRRLSTGEVVEPLYLALLNPTRWRYTTLRALDHFRAAGLHFGTAPDPRLAEAVGLLRARRLEDGRWPLDQVLRGREWLRMEEPGLPSRWITLKALRVLDWWDGR